MSFFLVTLVSTYLIIILNKYLPSLSMDNEFSGVQKFHFTPTPRIGGLSIFIGLLFFSLFTDNYQSHIVKVIIACSIPLFVIGIIEDLTSKIKPIIRLFFIVISSIIAINMLDINISNFNFYLLDEFYANNQILVAVFSVFALTGLVNGFNIIDGFNGLLSGFSLLCLISIAYLSNVFGDTVVFEISTSLIYILLGFFFFNFPLGRIFLGDSGAYFLGFVIGILATFFVNRHSEISHWYSLSLFIYPLFEVLFSIIRKKIKNHPSSQPDGEHFHMLVYKKIINCSINRKFPEICNSMTSPLIWMISSLPIILGTYFYNDPFAQFCNIIFFMFLYVLIYFSIKKIRA